MTSPTGPNHRLIRREEAVLVVIDVQERLLPHIDGEGEIVANLAKLGQFAEIIGLPALVTEQVKLLFNFLELL